MIDRTSVKHTNDNLATAVLLLENRMRKSGNEFDMIFQDSSYQIPGNKAIVGFINMRATEASEYAMKE